LEDSWSYPVVADSSLWDADIHRRAEQRKQLTIVCFFPNLFEHGGDGGIVEAVVVLIVFYGTHFGKLTQHDPETKEAWTGPGEPAIYRICDPGQISFLL
jgi:hypothetical protein